MQLKYVVMIAISNFSLGVLFALPFVAGSCETESKHARNAPDRAIEVMESRFDKLEKSISRLGFELSTIAEVSTNTAPIADVALGEELALMRDQLRNAVAILKSDAEQLTRSREDETVLTIPRNEEAFGKASQRVEWAISDGYWSEEDAMDLRLNLHKLTSSQQEKVILSLITALNSGEVQFDGVMPY